MRAFDFEQGGQPALLANAAQLLFLAEMIAGQGDMITRRHRRRHRQTLIDEILADRLGLTIRLLLARLVHQVVIDAHTFADTILFQAFLGRQRCPGVGVGQ